MTLLLFGTTVVCLCVFILKVTTPLSSHYVYNGHTSQNLGK